MIATADELVNLKPWEFGTLLVRADALLELGRWQEAADAYSAARREKPSSKEAYAGLLEANKQLRKADEFRNCARILTDARGEQNRIV